VVICLEQGADLHMAQLMPLPLTVSCFSKIQIGFTFLVLAHLGSPGKRAVKRVCVCVLFIILNMRYMQGYVSNILGQCLHLLLSSNEKNQKLNRTGKYTHTVMLMIAPLAYMLLLIGFPNMFFLMLFMQFFLWMHV